MVPLPILKKTDLVVLHITNFPLPPPSLVICILNSLEKDGKIRGEKGDGIGTNQAIGFLVCCGTAVLL